MQIPYFGFFFCYYYIQTSRLLISTRTFLPFPHLYSDISLSFNTKRKTPRTTDIKIARSLVTLSEVEKKRKEKKRKEKKRKEKKRKEKKRKEKKRKEREGKEREGKLSSLP
jgi:hypothetical protein